MESAVIINVIVAAALLGFGIAGAARGLFRSLAGLLILILSLVGAGLMADVLTEPVTKVVQPVIVRHLEKKIDAAVQTPSEPTLGDPGQSGAGAEESGAAASSAQEQEPEDLLSKLEAGRLLKLLGVDDTLRGQLAQQAQETVHQTGVTIAVAVAEAMAQSLVHALLFVLCFLALLLVLRLVAGAMDLLMKLPGLHFCNRLGGAALGLAEGALAIFLAIWVLRRLGVSFETETMKSAWLLNFFATRSPLDLLTFL